MENTHKYTSLTRKKVRGQRQNKVPAVICNVDAQGKFPRTECPFQPWPVSAVIIKNIAKHDAFFLFLIRLCKSTDNLMF